jgi:hypothetical protein
MSGNEIRLEGIVKKKKFGEESKSEHMAYWLVAVDGREFVLRRRDANPFMDGYFEKYINKKVTCSGEQEDYILFVKNISAD